MKLQKKSLRFYFLVFQSYVRMFPHDFVSCLLSGCWNHGQGCDSLPGLSQNVGQKTRLEGDQLPGKHVCSSSWLPIDARVMWLCLTLALCSFESEFSLCVWDPLTASCIITCVFFRSSLLKTQGRGNSFNATSCFENFNESVALAMVNKNTQFLLVVSL